MLGLQERAWPCPSPSSTCRIDASSPCSARQPGSPGRSSIRPTAAGVAPGGRGRPVIDPTTTWTVDPTALASRSRNTPYGQSRRTLDQQGPPHGAGRRAHRGRRGADVRPRAATPAGSRRGSVLADGTVFEGEAFEFPTITSPPARPCSNTVLSGYQEVITDPSSAGQVISLHVPQPSASSGGRDAADDDPCGPHCPAAVCSAQAPHPNWRSEGTLEGFLTRHQVAGISGVDARRLTRHLHDLRAGRRPAPSHAGRVRAAGRARERRARPRCADASTRRSNHRGHGPYRVVACTIVVARSCCTSSATSPR